MKRAQLLRLTFGAAVTATALGCSSLTADDSAPTEAELVPRGAHRACTNFSDAYPRLLDGSINQGEGLNLLDTASYGAATITESDRAYEPLRNALANVADAMRNGDREAARPHAAKASEFCEPILRGELPEPDPRPR
jgi:hypothetical protein